ncbi:MULTISPECIES: DUF2892 domain-containing protein [Rhodomicrobium]|uniref:YgaP family membrane protein n=1 Tax=Rhodomicrobium TaxID=1068 RepID=UPI000B4B796F|nr:MULTISPECIES: DUF2892 domain-containing protein [Rhodomicrobium]
MMTNIGVLDGMFRLLLGLALLGWSDGKFGPHPPEFWAWLAWIPGLALSLTGLFRFSPLYWLLGTDSCAPYPGRDRR